MSDDMESKMQSVYNQPYDVVSMLTAYESYLMNEHKPIEADKVNEAIAEIESLRAQVPKWVSVEEALPEHLSVVLINAGAKQAPHQTDAQYSSISEQFFIWDATVGDYLTADNTVTHWMPIPKPPAQEEV